MISNIRKRTGLDLECSNQENEVTNETLDADTYSVIELGTDTPKILTCRDRLPLYFHDLNELESRGMANHNAMLNDKVQLSAALDLLKKTSQVYDVYSEEEETDSSGVSFWIYVALR